MDEDILAPVDDLEALFEDEDDGLLLAAGTTEKPTDPQPNPK